MAARWHELVEERSPSRLSWLPGGASCIAGGQADGRIKRRYPEIAGSRGMIVPGNVVASLLAAAPAGATAR